MLTLKKIKVMKIRDLFKYPQKKVFLISFSILLLFILAQFITSCVWISRLLPYYVRAEKSAKQVYNLVIWTLILSIFDFIYIVVLLTFYIFCQKQCKSCTNASWKLISNLVMMIILLLIEIIVGFLASSYGLKGKHSLDNKCFKYVYDGFVSISQYIYVDQAGFIEWITKYADHADNDLKYFCENVGIPTFLWSFFQTLSCISIIIGFILAAKNPSEEDSTNEDDTGLNNNVRNEQSIDNSIESSEVEAGIVEEVE